ncbi:hypothetical protein EJB05_34192 [Eragrostis curvula]|uniref:Homeobox domain-containing protein n=1 Tax=Eragrostis curvula TaxID=38414 RepID=A0A5J9U311_9POAL|nr:hypothetical protein EJB05_34192 [Eragrostis curvula]
MPSQPQPQQREREQQRHELPVGPTRWCPTPEQLMILEEMYRGGLRTPNASQIQQITAHLSTYGRIEGKNVFYWFQNHKARDRQKLRRRLCMSHHLLSSCAAAHYYYGHGGGHGGFHLAAPPPTTVPFGGVGVFDQALLSPTSPTPAAAAAAAAAAYGYYYPTTAAFAAPPASRCATTPPSPNQQQLFHHYLQGAGGGCVAPAEAALGRPEYSLGKLDNFGVALDDVVSAAAATVDMGPPGFEVAPPPPAAFCRPLKTLDLFPGGLKEEQRDVA